MEQSLQISGQLVDVRKRETFPATLKIVAGIIESIERIPSAPVHFILPGFVDAHVHIESSMVVPSEFARVAVSHGTVATVSDPHEIANVLGLAGVDYMIENALQVPFKFFFGAPSCVPATSMESAGAELTIAEVSELLQRKDIHYLSEMMNYPGVIEDDPVVLAKIAAARKYEKPIDGHAPGVRGAALEKYIAAGITTDHESVSLPEAREKISLGMKILIREGSAARNFDTLVPLFLESPEALMFCSDDKHPDELLKSHINELVLRAVASGADRFDALHAACIRPVEHYKLPVGTLQPGDSADFIVVDSLESLTVRQTYIDGICVYRDGASTIEKVPVPIVNNFHALPIAEEHLVVKAQGSAVRVIDVRDGELVTGASVEPLWQEPGSNLVSNVSRDVLKLIVCNRYAPTPPAVAFVRHMGLQQGAIASSVAHDSHNIVAVGVDDEAIVAAVNALIEHGGGISVSDGTGVTLLPLPVAGLMSTATVAEVAADYERLDRLAKQSGSGLRAPFMTLSFLALLVIPELKLSDQGLFDGKDFQLCSLFVEE